MKSSKLKFTNSAGVFTLEVQVEGPEFPLPSNLAGNLSRTQITFDMQPESGDTGTLCTFSEEGLAAFTKYNYQIENAPISIRGIIGSSNDIVGADCEMVLEELEINDLGDGSGSSRKRVGTKLRKRIGATNKNIKSASVKSINFKGDSWLAILLELEEGEDPTTSFIFDTALDFNSLPGGDCVLVALKNSDSTYDFDEIIGNVLILG